MLALRAYLAVIDAAAELHIEVHRDLGSLTDSWKAWQERGARALVDVGFSRLPDAEIVRILNGHEARVLLSRPARDVFGRVGKCASRAADQSLEEGIPYFVAISGWGYELEDPTGPESSDQQKAVNQPNAVPEGGASGRSSELAELPLPLGGTASDLIDLAGLAAGWAADLDIGDERLAMSSAKQLSSRGVRSLRSLANTSPRFVERIPWMGPAKIAGACNSLRNLILAERAGPEHIASSTPEPHTSLHANWQDSELSRFQSGGGLLADFDLWLESLDPRDRDILIARTGRDGTPATLDAIAETVELTKERVRQITSRKLGLWSSGFDGLTPWSELDEWIEASGDAPWLDDAVRHVEWLSGLGDRPDFVRSMFDCFAGVKLNVVEIDGRFALTPFSQQDWRQEGAVFRRLIRAAVDDAMPVDLLRAALVGAASDFAGPNPGWLADVLMNDVIVARPVDTPPVVVGRSAAGESIVRKVLVESESPLHFSEIHRRAVEQGYDIELRRAHSAATAVGYLFDRGTYGTPAHTGLQTIELDEYRRMVEQVISNASPDRQWHSQDLFALVEPPTGSLAGEYLVDIVLEDSNDVVDLGRRVWASGLGSHRSTADRIDQQQAVESLLLAAGAPMATKAIQAQLKAHRGVGRNFQIHEAGKLVRTGVSQWGLIDRDVPLSVEQGADYLTRLSDQLNATSLGVHKTELVGLVSGLTTPVSPEMLMSVATRTGEFRGTQSDFVILPDWESHNRPTVPEAVAAMLAQRPVSTADLLDHARETVGLEIPMYSVHSALKHLGAEFDQSSNTWVVPKIG